MILYLYSGNSLSSSKENLASTQTLKNVLSFCGEMGFKPVPIYSFGDFIYKIIYAIIRGNIIVMVYPGLLRPAVKRKFSRHFSRLIYFLLVGLLGFTRKIILYVMDLPIDQYEAFRTQLENASTFSSVLEKILFKTTSKILVFNDDMKDIIIRHYSIPSKRFINFEILDYQTKSTFTNNIDLKKTFRIVYASGKLHKEYLENFVKNLPDSNIALFEFFGEEGEWINNLNRKNIIFSGPLSPDKLSNYISQNAHAGIIRNEQKNEKIIAYHNLTSTSKFGLFISSGVPVFCPDRFEYIYSLIEKYDVGWKYSDSEDVEKIIMSMVSDKEEYYRIKNNCLFLREKVISGYFFKIAVRKAILEIGNGNIS